AHTEGFFSLGGSSATTPSSAAITVSSSIRPELAFRFRDRKTSRNGHALNHIPSSIVMGASGYGWAKRLWPTIQQFRICAGPLLPAGEQKTAEKSIATISSFSIIFPTSRTWATCTHPTLGQ